VFDAATGGSVVDPESGSSITMPPNALAYPDGTPVEGQVAVSLAVIDVTDPAQLASMPGDFSAVGKDGTKVYLQSLGAAWVGATDTDGRELVLRDDAEGVTLDLKSNATADLAKLGEAVEAWSFNKVTGKWELEQTELKLDGETLPNSAAKVPDEDYSKEELFRSKKGKKRPMDYAPAASSSYRSTVTPSRFLETIARSGVKSLSTNLKKMDYFNFDVPYARPTTAVLLTGILLDAMRKPFTDCQIWSVGQDYHGRCADTTDSTGKFGALVGQFRSSIRIEVQSKRVVTDEKIVEVYFKPRITNKDWQKLQGTTKAPLEQLPGKYVRSTDNPLEWVNERGVRKDDVNKRAKITWCQARRQWHHLVDGQVFFVKSVDTSSEPGLPYGTDWQLASGALSLWSADPAAQSVLRPPNYARQIAIDRAYVGPFATGEAGKILDIGEQVVDYTITS
jgi:hypothetical protein